MEESKSIAGEPSSPAADAMVPASAMGAALDVSRKNFDAAMQEAARLRAELATADHRIARLEQGLWRAADALHANAEAWQVEGYPTNARIAEGQRRDAVLLLAAPTAAHPETEVES